MANVVMFTKPYTTKPMYVEIIRDEHRQLYMLIGIDVFGGKIREESKDLATVLQSFYHELCWMINKKVMHDTSPQRSMPKTASKKYSK